MRAQHLAKYPFEKSPRRLWAEAFQGFFFKIGQVYVWTVFLGIMAVAHGIAAWIFGLWVLGLGVLQMLVILAGLPMLAIYGARWKQWCYGYLGSVPYLLAFAAPTTLIWHNDRFSTPTGQPWSPPPLTRHEKLQMLDVFERRPGTDLVVFSRQRAFLYGSPRSGPLWRLLKGEDHF